MDNEFSEKASKLLDRINGINFYEKKPIMSEVTLGGFETRKTTMIRNNGQILSPQTQTVIELTRTEHNLLQNEEENCKKIKNLHEEVRKLETFMKEENENRLKINETFIHNLIKVEKNLQNTITNMRKMYGEREKKLESKIEQVLKQEWKQICEQLEEKTCINEEVHKFKQVVLEMNVELTQIKRDRHELEDKITRQFNDQINDLKTVFAASVRMREEREIKILEMLKNVYRKHLESLKKEEVERESSEKMFLTVIEQLIERIMEA